MGVFHGAPVQQRQLTRKSLEVIVAVAGWLGTRRATCRIDEGINGCINLQQNPHLDMRATCTRVEGRQFRVVPRRLGRFLPSPGSLVAFCDIANVFHGMRTLETVESVEGRAGCAVEGSGRWGKD